MSEAFTVADMLSTILLGMGIVFVVLIILYLIMVVQHKIFSQIENRHQSVASAAPVAQAQPNPAEDAISDEETAAILAVIAAYTRRDPSALRLVSLERH